MKGKRLAVSRFVRKCLDIPDAFEAADAITMSKYFQTVWWNRKADCCPEILRILVRVRSFIIHSRANGVFGLVSDYPVNVNLGEVERSLEVIEAAKSVRYIRKLKRFFPRRRYPRTIEEAEAVEEIITKAEMGEHTLSKELSFPRLDGQGRKWFTGVSYS